MQLASSTSDTLSDSVHPDLLFDDIFDYLEYRRNEGIDVLFHLQSFFRITSEIHADLYKKSQLQHFYLEGLSDFDR